MSTCCFVAGSTWWVTSRKRSGRWRSIRRHSDTKSPRCRTKLTGDTSMIDPCDVAASMSATSDSCAIQFSKSQCKRPAGIGQTDSKCTCSTQTCP
eukprot:363384-Chlamydomonas_euryale.AAC.27